ncbi:MAG: hypothetical protein M5U22_21140 [Thermoleophilia bacterium]|nr:hypothetical protein [Thermoleophilia bacterium]
MERRDPRHGGRLGLHRWVYYLTVGFLFAATVLRSVLLLDGAAQARSLLLLLAFPGLFVVEEPLTKRWRGSFALYLVLQCSLIGLLLVQSDAADFFAILFVILGMPAMQRYPAQWGFAALAAFVPVMALPLLTTYDTGEAVVLAMVYWAAAGLEQPGSSGPSTTGLCVHQLSRPTSQALRPAADLRRPRSDGAYNDVKVLLMIFQSPSVSNSVK